MIVIKPKQSLTEAPRGRLKNALGKIGKGVKQIGKEHNLAFAPKRTIDKIYDEYTVKAVDSAFKTRGTQTFKHFDEAQKAAKNLSAQAGQAWIFGSKATSEFKDAQLNGRSIEDFRIQVFKQGHLATNNWNALADLYRHYDKAELADGDPYDIYTAPEPRRTEDDEDETPSEGDSEPEPGDSEPGDSEPEPEPGDPKPPKPPKPKRNYAHERLVSDLAKWIKVQKLAHAIANRVPVKDPEGYNDVAKQFIPGLTKADVDKINKRFGIHIEADKLGLTDTPDAADLKEMLEENEDTVECCICYNLFDKDLCVHDENCGYICPDCLASISSAEDYPDFTEDASVVPEPYTREDFQEAFDFSRKYDLDCLLPQMDETEAFLWDNCSFLNDDGETYVRTEAMAKALINYIPVYLMTDARGGRHYDDEGKPKFQTGAGFSKLYKLYKADALDKVCYEKEKSGDFADEYRVYIKK